MINRNLQIANQYRLNYDAPSGIDFYGTNEEYTCENCGEDVYFEEKICSRCNYNVEEERPDCDSCKELNSYCIYGKRNVDIFCKYIKE